MIPLLIAALLIQAPNKDAFSQILVDSYINEDDGDAQDDFNTKYVGRAFEFTGTVVRKWGKDQLNYTVRPTDTVRDQIIVRCYDRPELYRRDIRLDDHVKLSGKVKRVSVDSFFKTEIGRNRLLIFVDCQAIKKLEK